MIVCPSCHQKNSEGAQTCSACGGSLEHFEYRACSACGALNAATSTYCRRCLSALIPEAVEGAEPAVEEAADLTGEPTAHKPSPQIDEELSWLLRREEVAPRRRATPPPAPAPHETMPPKEPEQPEPAASEEKPDEEPVPSAAAGPAVTEEQTEARISPAAQDSPAESQEAEEAQAEPEMEIEPADTVAPAEEEGTAQPPEEGANLLPEATIGTLADLDNLLPLEPAITMAHRVESTDQDGPTEADRFDAHLFHQVATERAPLRESAHEVLPSKPPALPGVGRILLNLMVLLAALVPFFTGGWINPWVQPRGSVVDLAHMIDALPPDATVLLSFDYDPSYAGELDPLALAFVRHLAARSVRSVVMSTNPTGMGLAQRIYSTVAEESPAYRQYGERYAILGYLPGLEAGLRMLNGPLSNAFPTDAVDQAPLSELPVTRGLATIRDIDRVVIISDSAQSVRCWIEQVRSRNGVQLDALVTARVEPVLAPYQQSGQLQTLIGGFEAPEYELVAGVRPSALNLADGYAAWFIGLCMIAVVTNVAYILRKKVRRSPA